MPQIVLIYNTRNIQILYKLERKGFKTVTVFIVIDLMITNLKKWQNSANIIIVRNRQNVIDTFNFRCCKLF